MLLTYKKIIATALSPLLSLNTKEIVNLLEIPRQAHQGQLSLAVFRWAKTSGQNPAEMSLRLANSINNLNLDTLSKAESMGGFLNFFLNPQSMQNFLLEAYMQDNLGQRSFGFSTLGVGKTLLIDFASPNVAKPMHVGHLRASIIGQALYNLAKTQSYKVIGLNHLGDWGVLFGRLVWAYRKWAKEYDFKTKQFESLYKLYVRFHAEAEDNPNILKEASLIFKQLESGDKEVKILWQQFVSISLEQYQKIWDRLGIKHDITRGESFYNDKLQHIVDLLNKKNLLKESQGAAVVHLEDQNMPPCLIKKSDGASLYATRDLASALYRAKDLKVDINLYVVGQDQNLHFKQLFAVLKKMDMPWADQCQHINFGMYKFKDTKMSSRKGHSILLEDILSQAFDKVYCKIKLKNPEWSADKIKNIAESISTGAVIFNDLSNDRSSDVEFCWDKILNFEGDSGPYVQYVFVRCNSLIKKFIQQEHKNLLDYFTQDELDKYAQANFTKHLKLPLSFMQKYFKSVVVPPKVAESNSVNSKVASPETTNPEIEQILSLLLAYDHHLSKAFVNFKPHLIAQYLLQLCYAFNKFYAHSKILDSKDKYFYIALICLVQNTIQQALSILNINCPDEM